jgi:hypothetical protein
MTALTSGKRDDLTYVHRLTQFMPSFTSPLLSLVLSLPQVYYTLSSLAALIILSLAYSRLCGLFGADKNMSITVKWGRERLVSSRSPNTAYLAFTMLASPSILPHRSHPPFCLVTGPLICTYAASRFPFLHSIPNSPFSAKFYRTTPIFPLILSNSSMLVPS